MNPNPMENGVDAFIAFYRISVTNAVESNICAQNILRIISICFDLPIHENIVLPANSP